MPILPSHAEIMSATEKKPAYYRLSILVLRHLKLESYDLKFGFVQN